MKGIMDSVRWGHFNSCGSRRLNIRRREVTLFLVVVLLFVEDWFCGINSTNYPSAFIIP